MKSTLPILVPDNNPADTSTINVPCTLPDSFDFRVFLPSRGVRTFTCWLTSTDPLKAEVKDVQLANREGDPRAGLTYEVDSDEQQRADDDASSVLDGILGMLGVCFNTRKPLPLDPRPGSRAAVLQAIAKALSAEEDAVSVQNSLWLRLREAGMNDAAREVGDRTHDLTRRKGQEQSPACEAMRCYVSHVVDAAVLAQSDKADRQLAEHPSQDDENEPGSERIRAARSLDVATLKCLDVEF